MTKLKEVPEMREALIVVKPYLPSLYQAFEEATILAKAFFETEGTPFEMGLYSSLVRHYFLAFFKKPGRETQWQFKKLNNNGVQIEFDEWLVRARKSMKGSAPAPTTETFAAFMKQRTLGGDFDRPHNMLLLWETNHKGDFLKLYLTYPLSTSLEKWRYEVPHPLRSETTISKAAPVQQEPLAKEIPLVYQSEFMFDDLDDLEVEYVGYEDVGEMDEDVESAERVIGNG